MYPILAAIHVATIVLWIGGVAFVTVIIFPMIQKMGGSLEQVLAFQGIEHRFGRHAKIYVALSGLTGFGMLFMEGRAGDLFTKQGLGITAMLVAWAFYLLVLMFEKRIFKRIFGKPGRFDSARVFGALAVFHWVILIVSMFAVLAGVWQGHGGRF